MTPGEIKTFLDRHSGQPWRDSPDDKWLKFREVLDGLRADQTYAIVSSEL
jgi:hypothetical protein